MIIMSSKIQLIAVTADHSRRRAAILAGNETLSIQARAKASPGREAATPQLWTWYGGPGRCLAAAIPLGQTVQGDQEQFWSGYEARRAAMAPGEDAPAESGNGP